MEAAEVEPQGRRQALGGFVEKWIAGEPELGIALNFLPRSQRDGVAAWACVVREIAHATFSIREADVAQVKLNWWHEELLGSGQGEPRHPLTQALAARFDLSSVPSASWQAVIATALQQRERDPAADFASQIADFGQSFATFASIESILFESRDVGVAAKVDSLVHALREVANIARVLENGHLALPLDLLARHRLRRDQLGVDSPERRRAASEQLQAIAAGFDQLAATNPALALTHRANLLANRWRASKAASASDPVAALARQLPKLSMTTTWRIWRAARNVQPGS